MSGVRRWSVNVEGLTLNIRFITSALKAYLLCLGGDGTPWTDEDNHHPPTWFGYHEWNMESGNHFRAWFFGIGMWVVAS